MVNHEALCSCCQELPGVERKLDNLRKYVDELEKMFNATLILQTDGRMTFERMLADVPEMKELWRKAL